jgi:two-component system, chemotaxis family, chemotaxis protein CheY
MPPSTLPKVLIVDDDDLMRTLLRGILRGESYQIIGDARNGILALEFIEKSRPDIVLLDVMMPEMDGLETLQRIRAKYPSIVVVMITGNPSVETVQESIQKGAKGFIIKPFNSAKVLETLERSWLARPPDLAQRED